MATYSPIQYGVQVANGTTVPIHPEHRKGDLLLVVARLRTTGKALGVPAGWERVAYNWNAAQSHSAVVGCRVAESSSETSGTWESDLITSIVLKGAKAVYAWGSTVGAVYPTASTTAVTFGVSNPVTPPLPVGSAVHHVVYGDTHVEAGIAVPSGFTNMYTGNIITLGEKAFINTGASLSRPSSPITPATKTCGISLFVEPKELASSMFIPFFT